MVHYGMNESRVGFVLRHGTSLGSISNIQISAQFLLSVDHTVTGSRFKITHGIVVYSLHRIWRSHFIALEKLGEVAARSSLTVRGYLGPLKKATLRFYRSTSH